MPPESPRELVVQFCILRKMTFFILEVKEINLYQPLHLMLAFSNAKYTRIYKIDLFASNHPLVYILHLFNT